MRHLDNFIREIEEIAYYNQKKVLEAFFEYKLSSNNMIATNGYGYGDTGREKLNLVIAKIFGAERCLASPYFMSGTHAISTTLFAILKPHGKLLSISGSPYDTLKNVIKGDNSLEQFDIKYKQIDLFNNNFDKTEIKRIINEYNPNVIFIQRSRGYNFRQSLTVEQIGDICSFIKNDYKIMNKVPPIIFVDNCYGEFCEKKEPIEVGADVVVGSFIKNLGGGLAPTGAYVCGKKDIVMDVENRFIVPNMGNEIGSYAFGYQTYFQGLFLAPHFVAQSKVGMAMIAEKLSNKYETIPSKEEIPIDTICAIKFLDKNKLIKFVQTVQAISPIDSSYTPLPWDMPGYQEQIIMAAGTFVQGATLELSADAPIREPYIGYVQGGLTKEHVRYLLEKLEQKGIV